MSVSGESRAGTLSFSDQITSRLHRWVQRTTAKTSGGIDEKARNIKKVPRESNHVKDDDLNIKKCSPRESLAGTPRDSRTILELEKALNDLINNCVTNTMVIETPTSEGPKSRSSPDEAVETTTKHIVEGNAYVDKAASHREGTTKDGVEDDGCQSNQVRHRECVEQTTSPSGDRKMIENHKGYSTMLVQDSEAEALPESGSKQIGKATQSWTTVARRETCECHPTKEDVEQDQLLPLPSRADVENDNNVDKLFDGGPNHSSKNAATTGANTSVSNANIGLNPGNAIKKQLRRISKTGWNVLNHSGKAKTTETKDNSEGKNVTRREKPPLRRIQSEGDALEMKLRFKDNDVTEFAETCIRHAQKKRLSEASSLESDPDPSNVVTRISEVEMSERTSRIEDSSFSKKHLSAPVGKDLTNLLVNNETVQQQSSSSRTSDQQNMQAQEHRSLSDRPTSLSFPLEIKNTKRTTKNSIFKHKTPSSDEHCSPTSPKHQSVSPKFRKFPCQPVFYVPKPNDISPPQTTSKKNRSASLTESKQTYTEHLI